MHVRGWALGAALALAGSAGPAAAAEPVRVSLPDGRGLGVRCVGSGPSVGLEAGWAANSRAWRAVLPLLAPLAHACAVDRAGQGVSDPASGPRSPAAVARDLLAALDAAGARPPLVLVGHSLGAAYVLAAAQAQPGRVAGLVLVDPIALPPDPQALAPFRARAERCLAALRTGPLPPDPAFTTCRVAPPARPVDSWDARGRELADLAASPMQLGPGALGDLPLVVLGAIRGLKGPALAFRREQFHRLAALSTRGRVVEVETGHLVMREAPAAVAAAVRQVLEARALAPSAGDSPAPPPDAGPAIGGREDRG